MDLAATVTLGSTFHAQALQALAAAAIVAPTGCRAIDDAALDGGFSYGEIITIAGAHGVGKTLFTYHAIYSHLRSHDAAEALIVDTHGGFKAARLRDVFSTRLQVDARESPNVSKGEDLGARAVSLLDRVKFTRVFDVVGIAQAVQEVADEWGQRDRDAETRRARVRAEGPSAVIPSSQDEEAEEEEVQPSQPYEAPPDASGGGTGLVVIDNIANHFSSELSKNAVQGQALLTSLLRSLHHLTRQRRICTILINNVVNTTRSSDAQHPRQPEDDASIFAAVQGKPALGRTLAYLVDQSILISRIPRAREDVARAQDPNPATRSACQYAGIFEVLKDRNGTREGAWAAFDIVDGLGLQSIGPSK